MPKLKAIGPVKVMNEGLGKDAECELVFFEKDVQIQVKIDNVKQTLLWNKPRLRFEGKVGIYNYSCQGPRWAVEPD